MIQPLEISALGKSFETSTGIYPAVRDFNVKIGAGEFVSIVGHSGCGKSTVLSIIAGLATGDDGWCVHRRQRGAGAWDRPRCCFPISLPASLAHCAGERSACRRSGISRSFRRASKKSTHESTWPWLASKKWQTPIQQSFLSARNNVWLLPEPWHWSRGFCCSMNPSACSIH